jgi:hypothetical protein
LRATGGGYWEELVFDEWAADQDLLFKEVISHDDRYFPGWRGWRAANMITFFILIGVVV